MSERTWREAAPDTSITYWDCVEDAEELRHEALCEAVEQYIDDGVVVHPGDDFERSIRQHFPHGLDVHGFRRRVVDLKWLEACAIRLVDRLEEDWIEEYGNPHEGLDDEERDRLDVACLETLKKHLPEPWQCVHIETVRLTADELIAALREWRPDWFEVPHG